ncbi:MAG: ABC transporter permease subunit, partial [Proteobacteria bacterium]|nr:ABC transporter permease subunit [Pseudomonadota bacterium]
MIFETTPVVLGSALERGDGDAQIREWAQMEQNYVLDFGWLGESLPVLLSGSILSIKLMLIASVASFAVGLLAGQLRMARNPILWLPAAAYIDFFRTTPILVQIVFFFFLLPIVFGVHTDAFTAGFIALSLNYGAFFAEIFRAGVGS